MIGTLYVVATPLGNLEDVTMRALRVLKEVDVIAAEDTRHSRKLLTHFGITTPLTSYHDHNERQMAEPLVRRMKGGTNVALISDAGTPGIADPGYRLVCAAIEAGISVVPIPGPSAVISVLSAGGLPTDRFCFEGFVPSKQHARRGFFAGLAAERRTIICYETARRLPESLADLEAAMGDRRIVVAREVTKIFEVFHRGTVGEVRTALEGLPLQGEVTLLIAGDTSPGAALSEEEIDAEIEQMRANGLHAKEIARALGERTGRPSREIYQRVIRDSGEE